MFHNHRSPLLLIQLCIVGKVIALCPPGTYLNLCGYCVGGTSEKNELEGLDRCGVCDGQGECVGCDGMLNSPRRRDACGLCLKPEAEHWNDCKKIESVYPSVLDLALDDNLVLLKLTGAGLKLSHGVPNNTECHILPVESQVDAPVVKDVGVEETDIQVKVLLTGSTGKYKIGCSEIEGFADLHIVDSRKLKVLRAEPNVIKVDETVQIELEVEQDGNYNGQLWCFAQMRGKEVRFFRTERLTTTKFRCSGYAASTPGKLKVGMVADEDAVYSVTGNIAEITVLGIPVRGELAELSPDANSIVIRFDQNVEISRCKGLFSARTQRSLGKGFKCSTTGDTLYVTLGSEPEMVESVEIVEGKSIGRFGSVGDSSFGTMAVVLPVSRVKVIAPTFSLSLPNSICKDKTKQPVVNVIVSRLGNQNLNLTWSIPTAREWLGKTQRENLIMWHNMRKVEKDLNNRSQAENLFIVGNNLFSGYDYAIKVDVENLMSANGTLTSSVKLVDAGSASVTVASIPSSSVIAAEVTFSLCSDRRDENIRYKWTVDGKTVFNDGKLIFFRDAEPGIYNVSCTIMDYHSFSNLGTGWALAQVVKIPSGSVVIFPEEMIIGTMDDIVLQAFLLSGTWHHRWFCVTSRGEPCIGTGQKAPRIEELVDVTLPILRIPAGILPTGRYTWTVKGFNDVEATLIIVPRIPPKLKVTPLVPGVSPDRPLFVTAEAERLKGGCTLRWLTVHKKGYDFFDLQEDVGLDSFMQIRVDNSEVDEAEIPLVVPAPTKNWKGLSSGGKYLLRLEALCPDPIPEAHLDVPVIVNAPPRTSDLNISPESGIALSTKFFIWATDVSDSVEDYPLMYSLSYKDTFDREVAMAVSLFNKFEILLPPGNITVIIRICDNKNSCSSSSRNVEVHQPSNISSHVPKHLQREIRNKMLAGDATEAYGLAITAFKCLPSDKNKFDSLLSVTKSAIRDRMRDLSERLSEDDRVVKSSLKFLELSVEGLKYIPEGNELVNDLIEFKNLIMKPLRRSKRESKEIEDALVGPTFAPYSHNLEENIFSTAKYQLLIEVKDYMLDRCTSNLQSPFNSSAVTFKIIKLAQGDADKELRIADDKATKLVIPRRLIKSKSCLATAKYLSNLTHEANTMYMVHLIRNGHFEEGSYTITMPLPRKVINGKCYSGAPNQKCRTILKTKQRITCRCNQFGPIYVMDDKKQKTTFSQRFVRNTRDSTLQESTIKAIFDLHAKTLEQNDTRSNRQEFLNDVRRYMGQMCNAIQASSQESVVIESSIVVLKIVKLTQKEVTMPGENGAKIKTSFKPLLRKTCLATAKYKTDFLENTRETRIADVYEVRLLKNGTIREFFNDQLKTLTVTIPLRRATKKRVCLKWSQEKGWTQDCIVRKSTNETITCDCKKPGLISVFINKTSDTVPTIGLPTTVVITSVTTVLQTNTTATGSTLTLPQNTTETTTISATTEKLENTTVVHNLTSIKGKNSYVSGTFKINEDYNEVVGLNEEVFREILKRQIAQQLNISVDMIFSVIIRRGSIIVTVFFVDSQEEKAETAVQKLLIRLKDGSLHLVGRNETVLNVPRQDAMLRIGSRPTRNTGKIRLIAYGVVAGTFLIIFAVVICATYPKGKRMETQLRLPHLTDHPSYRQFYNESSLEGSSSSLARYRRDPPFEMQTPQ